MLLVMFRWIVCGYKCSFSKFVDLMNRLEFGFVDFAKSYVYSQVELVLS